MRPNQQLRKQGTLTTSTAYVFKSVLDELEKQNQSRKAPMPLTQEKQREAVKARMAENEHFIDRQIEKMYATKVPDYL